MGERCYVNYLINIGPHSISKSFEQKNCDYLLTYPVLCAQKKRLSETVLLSAHNMFWLRK